MVSRTLAIMMFASAAVLSAPLEAQRTPPQGGRGDMFSAADANKDGFVTLPELQSLQEARFREMQQRAAQMMQQMFRRSDIDHDGKVSRSEAEAFQAAVQKRIQGRRNNHVRAN